VAILEDNKQYETELERKYYQDRFSLDQKKIDKERKERKKRVDVIMEYCLVYVNDVTQIEEIIYMLSERKEAQLMLTLTEHLFTQFNQSSEKRLERDRVHYRLQILTEESNFLASRKRDLDEEALEELNSLKETDKRNAEVNFGSSAENQKIIDKIPAHMIRDTFNKHKSIDEILKKDLPEEWRPYWIKYKKDTEEKVMELIFKYVENPHVLLTALKSLSDFDKNDITVKLVEFCFEKLEKIRKHTKKDY